MRSSSDLKLRCLLTGLAALVFLSYDRHRTSTHGHTPRKVYHCGYDLSDLTNEILPDFRAAQLAEQPPTSKDVLFVGMHSGCSADSTFPGKVVYLNGEPHLEKTLRKSYYLGPRHQKSSSLRGSEFYYISYASLVISGAQQALHKRPKGTNERFLLYTSSRCLKHRDLAFDMFSLLGTVTAGGACHGRFTKNYDKLSINGAWYNPSTTRAFSHFKFGLVMENSKSIGYITEKLLLAFVGGAIPIYYGTAEVFEIFNREAFVYYSESEAGTALAEVDHLLKNETAYSLKASQPLLVDGALEKYFWGGGYQTNMIRKFLRVQNSETFP